MQVSVPGSLMWFGEHAVLYGATGIVSAINRRIFLVLSPQKNHKIILESEGFGTLETNLQDLQTEGSFNFVLHSIKSFLPRLTTGFTLTIRREFSENLGLGSSAAVVVGTIALLHWWVTGTPMAKYRLWEHSLRIIRELQGQASGGDVAASIFGGIVKYRGKHLKKLELSLPLVAIYSGYKKATQEVIKYVENRLPLRIRRDIYRTMDSISRQAWQAILKENWKQVGLLMEVNRGLQQSLGVEDQRLNEILNFCKQQPQYWGAKISGAGLGDCVLGLGNYTDDDHWPWPVFHLKTTHGLKYDL